MATKKKKSAAASTQSSPEGEPISLSEAIAQTVAYKTSDLAGKAGVIPILVHEYEFAPKGTTGSGKDWCTTTGYHKSVYDLAEVVAEELQGSADVEG